MLTASKLIGFVATTKPTEAKYFYEQCLGLPLVEDGPYALVFASGENKIRVQKVELIATPPYTSLGWSVDDITSVVQSLVLKGVNFQYYAGLPQNELGIWITPDGSQVAWFQDPDGNTLSLTQYKNN